MSKKEELSYRSAQGLRSGSFRLFRYGQSFVDAMRNTLCVLLPISLFFYIGKPDIAIELGTGALLIGLADLPGNRSDKLLSAWSSLALYFIVALVIAAVQHYPMLVALVVAILAFILTMFGAFGQRLGAVGAIGLVVATFTIGLHPVDPLSYAIYLSLGGAWYYFVSLLQVWFFPYHPLQRAITKCRKQTAELLRLRATGYDPSASLSGFNQKNISLHLKITASHELMRKLLLGDRFAAKTQDQMGVKLLHMAITVIDLYEKISAVHHEYPYLRKKLLPIGVLPAIHQTILLMATQIEGDEEARKHIEHNMRLLSEMSSADTDTALLLDKLLANLRDTALLAEELNCGGSKNSQNGIQISSYGDFISPERFSVTRFKSHMMSTSPIFRFAIRLSVLLLAVTLLITTFPLGGYAYWLPLTLLVVSRPSFVHTKRRNIERILGTLLGLISGWLLMQLDPPVTIMLAISAVSLFVFFFFIYSRYWAAAYGITLAVVLCLGTYQGRMDQVLLDRLLFTLLGCVIGLAATFFFPIWHSSGLKTALLRVLVANRNFLDTALKVGPESQPGLVRLARKESYLALAALSESILLSNSEPGRGKKSAVALRHVELLCFQCNALISAMTLSNIQRNLLDYQQSLVKDLDLTISAVGDFELRQLVKQDKKSRINEPLDLSIVIMQLKTIFATTQK